MVAVKDESDLLMAKNRLGKYKYQFVPRESPLEVGVCTAQPDHTTEGAVVPAWGRYLGLTGF